VASFSKRFSRYKTEKRCENDATFYRYTFTRWCQLAVIWIKIETGDKMQLAPP